MSARSTLTVTSGSVITTAWAHGVRDHMVSSTAGSTDVSAVGQLTCDTTVGRFHSHTGTSSIRVPIWIKAAGRTWASRTCSGSFWLNATATEIPFATVSSDNDAVYGGWNGSHFVWTIPTGLGGLWQITWDGLTSTSSGTVLSTTLTSSGGAQVTTSGTAATGTFGTGCVVWDLADGASVWLAGYQNTGASIAPTMHMTMVRLGA